MLKQLFALFCLFLPSSLALATEKVVLQLKWEHEFQFAGFYAAKWQGFYEKAGLDVEIRSAAQPDGSLVAPIEELTSGNADFAIGGLDILIARDEGKSVTVLAPIFQRSASAVFTLAGTHIDEISQLAKLTIAATDNDTTKSEIVGLFLSRGYRKEDIKFVDEPVTLQTLIDKKADAIVTYEVSAYFEAQEKGLKLNKLHPREYGVNFYGDTLYTSQQLAQSNPQLVNKFVQASLKGWEYALKNKKQVAERISSEYPRYFLQYEDFLGYNLKFANLIESLLEYPANPIGHLSQDRWFAMNERIRSLGIVRSSLTDDSFFFSPPEENPKFPVRLYLVLAVIILIGVTIMAWYRRQLIPTLIGIIGIAGLIEYQIEENLSAEQKRNERISLIQQLNSVAAKLEGNLLTNLSMINGFAAYISAEPELSYDDFSKYAREVFKKEPMLINFAAAKDLVINYVYPIQGNEKAIGLDYRKVPAQLDMVLQVAKTGQLLVVGPVNLVQGGVAFIGRAPIFTGDGLERRLWGIISAPLDAEQLYTHSDIYKFANDVNLSIKSFDSLGRGGPVFYGEEKVFNHPDAIKSVISVGGGTWHLAVTPKLTSSPIPNIIFIRIVMGITVLLFCAFAAFRLKQEQEKQRMQATILGNQRLLEKVGSVARIGGWKLDQNLKFVQWSEQTSILIGKPANYQPESFDDISHLFEPVGFELWKSKIEKTFKEASSFDIELQLNTDGIDEIWMRIIASAARDSRDRVTGTMQDVTDKVKSAQFIRHQATYDPLTNLPNRVLFNDRLTQAIENAQRNSNKIGVLFIDLDRFKPVNDNYGHQVGDLLLKQAANRIETCLRDSDTVARLSGDEFAVLLLNVNKFDDAILVTEKIIDTLQETYRLEDLKLHCSASIGISFYPDDGKKSESLLRKADQAMYEVKKSGRNGWQFYTRKMQELSEYRHQLLNKLIVSVSKNELIPYFQPIMDLQDNQVVKCETLARWPQSDGSFVSPMEFIALAEESGLVNKIDLNMLQSSSAIIENIIADQSRPVGLSVNVSPRLFHTKDRALEIWLEHIQRYSRNIEITVEITERLITDDTQKALNILNQLKSYGVKIAIDDFGTGYSSLSYLVRFPVDIIKIDRSFVDGIGKESSAESLIETILIMAKKLDIKVVAEGIETQAQLEFLKQLGCDFGQGYLLAKPMPKNNFTQFLKTANYA